jgi:hypothetical protein
MDAANIEKLTISAGLFLALLGGLVCLLAQPRLPVGRRRLAPARCIGHSSLGIM